MCFWILLDLYSIIIENLRFKISLLRKFYWLRIALLVLSVSPLCLTFHIYNRIENNSTIPIEAHVTHLLLIASSGEAVLDLFLSQFSSEIFFLVWSMSNSGYFLPFRWNIKIMRSTYSYYHQMILIQMFWKDRWSRLVKCIPRHVNFALYCPDIM